MFQNDVLPLTLGHFSLRLVCSDLISRGIDISHVSHVVSYDAPVDMRKYVHRVGRTARAGRTGDAWTLVEEQEVCIFRSDSLGAYLIQLLLSGAVLQKYVEIRRAYGCSETDACVG